MLHITCLINASLKKLEISVCVSNMCESFIFQSNFQSNTCWSLSTFYIVSCAQIYRRFFFGEVLFYTERQRECCDDASDTGVIENNAVTPEMGCNPNLE